jgi:hypothetical protein
MMELLAVLGLLIAFFAIGVGLNDLKTRKPRLGYPVQGAVMGGFIYLSKVILSDKADFILPLLLAYVIGGAIILGMVSGGWLRGQNAASASDK